MFTNVKEFIEFYEAKNEQFACIPPVDRINVLGKQLE